VQVCNSGEKVTTARKERKRKEIDIHPTPSSPTFQRWLRLFGYGPLSVFLSVHLSHRGIVLDQAGYFYAESSLDLCYTMFIDILTAQVESTGNR